MFQLKVYLQTPSDFLTLKLNQQKIEAESSTLRLSVCGWEAVEGSCTCHCTSTSTG